MMTARDVLTLIADSMPQQRFTLIRYQPRSGAVQRAREVGADLVSLLLDVTPDMGEQIVPAWEVGSWLAQNQLAEGEVVALGSRLSLGAQHLLLLDFAIPCSLAAQDDLVHCLRHCGWRGWLLCSGASYHFIGTSPMDPSGWRREMARALLIPGIDVRYMGHCLHREQGTIRLTTCPLKPTEPYVVAVLS